MTKGLPWTRLLAEGVIVVASILLALTLDAWWSNRQEESARQEWLTSLEADFETNALDAVRYADRSAGDRDLAQRFVFMSVEEATRIPQDSTWAYLMAIWRPNPAPLNTEAIVAALEAAPDFAGRDDELRRAIGEWRVAISYLTVFDARLWELQDLAMSALGTYPEMQRAFAENGEIDGVPIVPSGVLAKARGNAEIVNLASQKVLAATLQMRFLSEVAAAAENARDVAGEARAR